MSPQDVAAARAAPAEAANVRAVVATSALADASHFFDGVVEDSAY